MIYRILSVEKQRHSFPDKKANAASDCFFFRQISIFSAAKSNTSFPYVAIVVIIGDGHTYILDKRFHLLEGGLTFQVFPERTDQRQLTRPFVRLEGGAGHVRLIHRLLDYSAICVVYLFYSSLNSMGSYQPTLYEMRYTCIYSQSKHYKFMSLWQNISDQMICHIRLQ